MKKSLLPVLIAVFAIGCASAETTVFDSMDKAVEVKMQPAISTATKTATEVQSPVKEQTSIQEESFANAITNLDDAQVELRQQYATTTSKYNEALAEKKQAIEKCRQLKSELAEINKKMRNIDKSKKMINANLEKVEKK